MATSTVRPFLAALVCLVSVSTASAQRPDRDTLKQLQEQDPGELLDVVHSYLQMVADMRKAVSDPLTALILVQHDMKELYQKTGTADQCVAEFRRILDALEDPAARTAVRFSIVDVYKIAGKPDKALEELRAIADESTARINAAK